MNRTKNKLIFYLATLSIYLLWMAAFLIAQHKGIHRMTVTLLCFIIYLHIGMEIFYRIHWKYYEGLHSDSKKDTWFNRFMCWVAWPAALINYLIKRRKNNKNE